MQVVINNKKIDVEITYKNNKNMYLRVGDDLKIHISAPYKISLREIEKFISANNRAIVKMYNAVENKKSKNIGKFLYLGKSYDIVYIKNKRLILSGDTAYIGSTINIDKYYKNEALEIFKKHLDYCYNLFDEKIPYPIMQIRKMKTRWGVCNTKEKKITLNLELIKLDLKYLDYVCIHELAHLIHPNHSSKFWKVVEKYEPNYKQYRKEMKNII